MPIPESLAGPWAVINLTGCDGASAGANLDYALKPTLFNDSYQWANGLYKVRWDDVWIISHNDTPRYTKAVDAAWPWSEGAWTPSNGTDSPPTLTRKNAMPVRLTDPLAHYPSPSPAVPPGLTTFSRIYLNAADEICFVFGDTEKYIPANTRPYDP